MEYHIADRIAGVQGSMIRELFKLAADPNMIAFGGGNPSPDTFPTGPTTLLRCFSTAFPRVIRPCARR